MTDGSEGPAQPWEFAGWGRAERINDINGTVTTPISRLDQTEKHRLGTWKSTAICGNDITSSVLYVSALAAVHAGALAPVVLLIVAAVLYLYRKVYSEVLSALPLNGGTYTVLLNTTNKRLAAGAACLTLLSYLATAVISANEGMQYAQNIVPNINVVAGTIGVLGFFTVLNLIGISESAVVALVIFITHLATLTVLVVTAGVAIMRDPSMLMANMVIPNGAGLWRALFLGFAAAMLGISGFESSANFIEEQKQGVFPKTLRNMWFAVAIFNPLISFLALGLLPLAHIQEVPRDLLAEMGAKSFGGGLAWWVSLDAVLVLSGAVLTSFVGVTGLVRRMSLDRVMPQFFLLRNRVRNTNHWIILGFFALSTSILIVTSGAKQLETLSGVYTLAFLSVMALFAIGNMLLKKERGRLPRDVQASWMTVTVALFAVLIGIVGNIVLEPRNVGLFLLYTAAVGAIVVSMFLRIEILKLGLFISRAVADHVKSINEWVRSTVRRKIDEINSLTVAYFTKGDDVALLNRAALYVLKNEQTRLMKVIHVYDDEAEIPPDLADHLKTIDRIYPQLRIDFLAVKGEFSPRLIEALSQRLGIPKNYMFIGTPGDHLTHRIEDLGGVRVIL